MTVPYYFALPPQSGPASFNISYFFAFYMVCHSLPKTVSFTIILTSNHYVPILTSGLLPKKSYRTSCPHCLCYIFMNSALFLALLTL